MTDRDTRRIFALLVLTLLGIGCIAVYSATAVMAHQAYGQSLRFLTSHLMAIGGGLVLGLCGLAAPLSAVRGSAKALVVVSVAVLVLVLIVGQEINGANRWFRLGRLSIQPSEFAKLALVIYLADFLARKRTLIGEWQEGLVPPLLVAGLMAGLVLLQPDLGTAVAIGTVAMVLLMMANARWRHLGVVLGVCAVALVILVAGEEYRRRRLLAFVNPWQDPQGAGFQMVQSYLALAGGGLLGQGLGGSVQKLFYLPGAHTDFIFAVIGEELGLLGTTAIIGLFALLISCGVRMVQRTDELFRKYLIAGCMTLIGFGAIVHMAVVTGLLPTKGLPLPFVSYGGTSMVSHLVAGAFILNASRRPHPAASNP